MQPYLEKALHQFDVKIPVNSQDAPYPHIPLKFGAKMQHAEVDNSSQQERQCNHLSNKSMENIFGTPG